MRLCLAFLGALCLMPALAVGQPGSPAGLVNGSFERAGPDGQPEGWTLAGDSSVRQQMRRERAPRGGWQVAVECRELRGSGPASHAMLAQYDTLKLQRGRWYRFRMSLRAENLEDGAVSVAVSNTADWSNCGLNRSALATSDWSTFTAAFQATQTVSRNVRLQIWWHSTGTVWLRDLSLVEIAEPLPQLSERAAPSRSDNLVPNGGFEAGTAGWGSIADVSGWGGNLNRLVGRVVERGARSGRRCLEIALSPAATPVYWFDYYQLTREPVRMPLAANRGWITVRPGRRYVFSAWLRSDLPGLAAVLRAIGADGRRSETRVTVGASWQRFELAFTPASGQAYVAAGPDLKASGRDTATLWMDDVALSEGAAGLWQAAAPVEVGVRAAAEGGLFAPGEAPAIIVELARASTAVPWPVLRWSATDFHDRQVASGRRVVGRRDHTAPDGCAARVRIALARAGRGFYRIAVEADGVTVCPPRPIRLAVLPVNRRADTVCGMNHAYPDRELLALSRRIGLGWFRDWSLKWQDVEPERGRFTFAAADAQIDRVRAQGLKVLALLPFPSAAWASSAGGRSGGTTDGVPVEIASAPKDPEDLASYVKTTVSHLRGRVDTFEVFNEPVYTGYSLPASQGYTVADYVRWLRVAAAAAKQANPQAFVVGGIQCPPNEMMEQFVEAGGAGNIDAVSIHHYPGMSRPEALLPGLARLRAALATAGRKEMPLYWTEGAYYAADGLDAGAGNPWWTALPSERLCAAYMVRLNAILCAANTRRIIYHSGTPGEINRDDPTGIFFEYDGLPRKMTPALAAFNEWIGPDFISRGALPAPPGIHAFRFESGGKSVIIAWSVAGPKPFPLSGGRWSARDLMGEPVPPARVRLTGEPIYLVAARDAPDPGFNARR